jgi:ABC-type nitrate/sulfonate/bicarbonate transport system substrate-binding protein
MAIWLKVVTAALLLTAAPSGAQELVKIPVQIPAITPAVTAFVVARERGYYRQEGLDVQFVVMPSGLGTQALLGGNVKFSTAGGAGLMPILRGAPAAIYVYDF